MNIGIDLRPLQNGHKYRGIGEVAKQVTNKVLAQGNKDGHEFTFYQYKGDDPLELLNVPKGLKFSTVLLGVAPEDDTSSTKLDKLHRNFSELYGAPIRDSARADVFLQYDYAAGVPKDTRTVLVKHDLIPYIFRDQYFESAWVPFKNKALRTTLRTLFANHKFMQQLRRGLKNARTILTVSESTKHDLERYFKVPAHKVKVARLGVDVKPAKTSGASQEAVMPTKPYLLFVGAADARRRVEDAVHTFNNLKAKGHDIQLVLAGENFRKPEHIPNPVVREAVLKSSYKKDILTLGYISDEQKQQLFKNAIAYVYPTMYEGFGIPILEAMLMDCPVITYDNSSTHEVGGEHAMYVDGWDGIMQAVNKLTSESKSSRNNRLKKAHEYARNFTWDKTASVVYDTLINSSK